MHYSPSSERCIIILNTIEHVDSYNAASNTKSNG
jgi:hypothetical protein